MLAQFKIVIFFLPKFYFPPLRRELAVRSAFFISQELFLAHRVITRLLVFVDLPFIKQSLQHSLHTFFVQRIGRCRPSVVMHIQLVPQRNELFCHSSNELLRRHTLFLG